MRRELQTEQMRRRILDSALEVFGAEGYDGASMNAICTRAGISKGIIYHYFAGKEDLYLSCCRESTQKVADYLREHTVSGGDAPAAGRGNSWHCVTAFSGSIPGMRRCSMRCCSGIRFICVPSSGRSVPRWNR